MKKPFIKMDPSVKETFMYLILMMNFITLVFCPFICMVTFVNFIVDDCDGLSFIASSLLFLLSILAANVKRIGNYKNPLYKLWRTPLN